MLSNPIVCLLGLAGLAVAQSKPAVNPAINRGQMETDLRNYLRPTQSTWNYWGAGWIPQSCRDIATGHGLNPFDFTVFNVFYTDCSEPWIMCRHRNAGASEIDMIDMLGRMPVRMRSYVRQFVATPGLGDGAAAFTYSNGDVVVESRPNADVLLHELSHSLDWNAAPLRQYGFQFSSTNIWQSNYNQDSASPTPYARTNWLEDFAESGLVGVYDKVVPGGISRVLSNWQAIFHQYATFQGYLGDVIIPGGSCANRFGNSAPVAMGSSSAKFRMGPEPDVSLGNNVTMIEVNPENEGKVIKCTKRSS